jgi:hypothetical protein
MTGQELMVVHLGILALAVFSVGLSLYNFIKDRRKGWLSVPISTLADTIQTSVPNPYQKWLL